MKIHKNYGQIHSFGCGLHTCEDCKHCTMCQKECQPRCTLAICSVTIENAEYAIKTSLGIFCCEKHKDTIAEDTFLFLENPTEYRKRTGRTGPINT